MANLSPNGPRFISCFLLLYVINRTFDQFDKQPSNNQYSNLTPTASNLKSPSLYILFCDKNIKSRSRTKGALYPHPIMAAADTPNLKFFKITFPAEYVAHVEINRPEKLNAFFDPMWHELKVAFDSFTHRADVRAIILSGAGDRAFTAGTYHIHRSMYLSVSNKSQVWT